MGPAGPKGQGKYAIPPFSGGKSGSKSTRPAQSQLSSLIKAHRQVMQAVNPFMAHRCGYSESEAWLDDPSAELIENSTVSAGGGA